MAHVSACNIENPFGHTLPVCLDTITTIDLGFIRSGCTPRTTYIMESPHEHQQNLLLSRIITNVEKLNEAVVVMNKALQEINIQNMNIELVAQMFKNYQSNVLFHLEATDNLKEPS
ncbi:DASH complex subunit Dad4 domain-containing protein [Neurospora intermedia]|uniref:DASH complex subunit DAD4 n=1 Tax=Neurospora intermedia TaxID=5142 RepID=A0ABR3DHT0_NEUIN